MGAVYVGVGHDDDFAVAELGKVEVFANACAQGCYHGHELFVAVDFVEPCFFYVEHFAP